MNVPHAVNGADREIIHVVARFPPALGGMETAVQALARDQFRLGIRVRVLTSGQSQNGMPQEDEAFPVDRLKGFTFANTPIIPSLLYRLFRTNRASVIHVHIAHAYIPEMVWLHARLRRVPYIAHFHCDVIASGWAGFVLEPYKKSLLRRALRDAATVVVPTDDYRSLVCSKFRIPASRVVVVPNGTDHRIAEQPKSLGEEWQVPRLLFVGRLALQKNVPLLLRAVAVYAQKYDSRIQLTVVGEGDMRPVIEAEIDRLGLGTIVTLTGALHGASLESVYETSDLLLLTSINESFGIVFVEAMTKALPIVSVNIPAVRNVVINGVNGLLAESTPEALAGAIHALLTERDLYERVSSNNLAKSRDYSWRTIAEQISKLYDAL